jgi:tetratricopeptide (TPR) repeat protein
MMKILLYVISILLIPSAVYSQTNDKNALEAYNKGMDKFFKKNYMGAIFDFSEAIRRDSGFIQAYENRGVAKYYLNDYREAIGDFNKALEINPNDYNTYGRRGWAKYHLQDCKGAIADFTKAIEGGRNEPQYYNVRGQAKYYLHEYNGAITDFNKVINSWTGEKEQRAQAFYWRGLVNIDLGQKENACIDFNKARKLGYEKAYEIIEVYCK